jgi:hypothetical protein
MLVRCSCLQLFSLENPLELSSSVSFRSFLPCHEIRRFVWCHTSKVFSPGGYVMVTLVFRIVMKSFLRTVIVGLVSPSASLATYSPSPHPHPIPSIHPSTHIQQQHRNTKNVCFFAHKKGRSVELATTRFPPNHGALRKGGGGGGGRVYKCRGGIHRRRSSTRQQSVRSISSSSSGISSSGIRICRRCSPIAHFFFFLFFGRFFGDVVVFFFERG